MKKNPLPFTKTVLSLGLITLFLGLASLDAQVVISGPGYSQNFDDIGTSLPTGWTVRNNATSSTLGTSLSFNTAETTWGTTTGNFRNVASATGLSSGSSNTAQGDSTDRALGVRQSGSFADPGASFNFNFSTIGVNVAAISLDMMMLDVEGRSTTWSIQYGIGASPTSWTTLGTYADPGTWGTTHYSFNSSNFGTSLDNLSSVWFRVAALTAATGSGSRDTFAIDNFSLSIPEPASAALLLTGLGAVFVARKRRK